jgi:hypothetical protein
LHGKTPLPCAEKKRTAKRALCHAFFAPAHGKDLIFAVRFAPRRTAKGVTRRLIPVSSVAFFLPCIVKKRTAKIIYRALSDVAHGKGDLPCKMLPCALCRAPRRKTQNKEFAVRFMAFAVRSWCTAKPLFPCMVSKKRVGKLLTWLHEDFEKPFSRILLV